MSRRIRSCTFLTVAWLSLQTPAWSEHGAGTPPQPTYTPLPVQTYAVIDLAAGSTNNDGHPLMSLDDSSNLAFAFVDNATATQITYWTFQNGVLSSSQTHPATVTKSIATEYQTVYTYVFNQIRTNGQVGGYRMTTHIYPDGGEAYEGINAYTLGPGSSPEVDLALPAPYSNKVKESDGTYFDKPESGELVALTDKSLSYVEGYYSISEPDGTFKYEPGELSVLISNGKTTIFDSDVPSFVEDTNTTEYYNQVFSPSDLNDTGSALGGDSKMWNGSDVISTGVSTNRYSFCLNNQNFFLTYDYNNLSYNGGIYIPTVNGVGMDTKFTDLLKGGPWEHQLISVHPIVLSNQDITSKNMYVVTSLQDSGVREQVVWKYGAPSTPTTAGGASSTVWQPYKMQFPPSTTIQDNGFEIVSSSGIIAAIGNSGKGDNHALLLVPMGLRLFNCQTTNFDGSIVKDIIPAPENPNHNDDQGAQNGDDALGAKALGLGRTDDTEGCFYDLMVAAKAPAIPWLHYMWERRLTKVEWNIRKSIDGKYWYVTVRNNYNGDDAGETPLHSNHDPSPQLNQFYNWDDTGMHYEAGDGSGDPEHRTDPYSQTGDYVYCEKLFTYKILFSLGGSDWDSDTVQWQEGVRKYVFQKILVQERAHTPYVTTSWIRNYNLVYEANQNPSIDESKVRSLVKGNLPIVLAPDANPYQ